MDALQEQRARKLVQQLKSAGENCGLLVSDGTVVLRAGVTNTDTPMMFEESDLNNAIALDLLQKHKSTVVSMSKPDEWEWYVLKERPRVGDSIILSDGSRVQIGWFETGIAFYGQGNGDFVPVVNLVPALSGEANCWNVDSRL
jgi:hypothetical protein